MKKKIKACLAVIAVTFMALSLSYYLYLRSAIQIINKVPPAFNKQLLVFSEGGVAVVHDNKMLHIINKSNQPLMSVKYAFLGKQHTLFEYDLSNKNLKKFIGSRGVATLIIKISEQI